MGLLWLEKKNLQATVQDRISAMLAMTELRRGTSVIDPAPFSGSKRKTSKQRCKTA